MISGSKEEDSPTKKEGNTRDEKIVRGSCSSSTPWLRLKDPRIVRVSRAFGGKDRHSKVCTIRGLRDRRVRLSVPTAIQLFDLQDRLGFKQPSKVVDWLLNAAKDEIDELPPLPIPPINFALNHLTSSHEIGANSQSSKQVDGDGLSSSRPSFWSNDSILRDNSKQVVRDAINEKENWTKRDEDDEQESAQTPSFFQLDHPNFPLTSQIVHDIHNLIAVPLPSTLSLSSGSQILVPQPYFPPHLTPTVDFDPRQMTFASSTQNLFPSSLTPTNSYSMNQSSRPFHFNIAPNLFNSQNEGSQSGDKDQDFPCK